MKNGLGKYYLGATVVNKGIIFRTQRYTDKVRSLFGVDLTIENERHITIIPPFQANYVMASDINLDCAMSTLLSTHPLTNTVFSIEEMQVMSFGELDVVHFPVRVHKKSPNDNSFVEYVQALRRKIRDLGIKFKTGIPREYRPHITVLVGEKLHEDPRLQAILKESDREKPLFFRSAYPTLYADYSHSGWQTLSQNPALIE